MPIMDGYETTRAIRNLAAPHRNTPIIAMTAGARVSDRDRCLAAGMDDYVSKPMRLRELVAVITRCTSEEGSISGLRCESNVPAADLAPKDSTAALDATMIFELQELDSQGGGMAELVVSFLSHASAGLEELRRGIAEADGTAVAGTCHRLLGSSANLGASTMAAMFAELEVAAVGSTLQGAPDILRRLEAELARVQPELTAAFANTPS